MFKKLHCTRGTLDIPRSFTKPEIVQARNQHEVVKKLICTRLFKVKTKVQLIFRYGQHIITFYFSVLGILFNFCDTIY